MKSTTNIACRTFGVAVVLSLLCALPSFAGSKFKPAVKNPVLNEYLVELVDDVASTPSTRGHGLPPVAEVARSLAAAHGGQVSEVWEHALQGFVVHMPEARARELADDSRVRAVEQNFAISTPVADCYLGTSWQDTRQLPSPTASPQALTCTDPDPLNDFGGSNDPPACRDNWGLDRLDQTSATRNSLYSFVNNGTTVHVYTLDTGINRNHREFLDANGVSRVSGGADATQTPVAAGTPLNTADCSTGGHGTHVAAIIAGRTYGIAKNVLIHPVRFTCGGTVEQQLSAAIRGLDWISSDVQSHRPNGSNGDWPAVINWSGGNDPTFVASDMLRDSVMNVSFYQHIVMVQSAGNQSAGYDPNDLSTVHDACDYSEGERAWPVIIAGGIDFNDGRWVRRSNDPEDQRYINVHDYGSNLGSCIDIWAPAMHIVSASRNGNDLACRLSGTSMAAPHVTGVVAAFLQSNPAWTSWDVKRALRSRGTWNALQSSSSSSNSIGPDSDNVILYSDTRSLGDAAPVAAFSRLCPGRQCSFNADTSFDDVQIASYSWKFGDGTTGSGLTASHIYPANFQGYCTLTVTDNTGKTDHYRERINVNADSPPAAAFSFTCSGLTCTFNANGSTDDNAVAQWNWNFGDNTTAAGLVASHTFATAGNYTVQLTVTDSVGQTDTTSKTINPGLASPSNLSATASGATVTITWTLSGGATAYNIERKVSSGPWQSAGSVSGSTSIATDTPTSSSGVVLYHVYATASGALSGASNNDMAFTGSFSDDPISASPPYTTVKAQHITQMRAAVNGLLEIGGQPAVYSAADLDPNNLRSHSISRLDFTTLMSNLNTARTLPGVALTATGFRTTPAAGGRIKRTDLEDLRLGVK
jgi:serine protease